MAQWIEIVRAPSTSVLYVKRLSGFCQAASFLEKQKKICTLCSVAPAWAQTQYDDVRIPKLREYSSNSSYYWFREWLVAMSWYFLLLNKVKRNLSFYSNYPVKCLHTTRCGTHRTVPPVTFNGGSSFIN